MYHACPDCFQQDRSVVKNPATNQTLNELFRTTKKLEELGYNTIVVWEQKFQNQFLLHKSQDMHTSIYRVKLQVEIN